MNCSTALSQELAGLFFILLLVSLSPPACAACITSGGLCFPTEKSIPGFSIPFPPPSASQFQQQDPRVATGILPEAPPPPGVRNRVAVMTNVASLPFSFIPNTGQIADRNISFTVKGSGSTLYFTPGEVIIDNVKNSGINGSSGLIRQSFPGANPAPVISGIDELPGKVNYFLGRDPSGWRSDLPTYGSVMYYNLYPGIDLRYFGNEGYLKREFYIAPGVDPGRIAFRYDGITGIAVDSDGSLNITTTHGVFRESPPVSYQMIGGRRVNVIVRYAVTGPDTTRLVTGIYDPAYPLTIDPKLGYSTYYGGSQDDGGLLQTARGENEQKSAVIVDPNGNSYVTGFTSSNNFPTTAGAYKTSYGGQQDVFVMKMDSNGTAAIWATYLGGTLDEMGNAIALDAGGNVTVTGFTTSPNFPTTPGVFNATYIGSPGTQTTDVFVTKLNSTGNALIFSTYYGGSDGEDLGLGIVMDTAMNVYFTGLTSSTNMYTSPGAVNTTKTASAETQIMYVVKLKPDGSAPVYSTFYGGNNNECDAHGIALDSDGNVYIAGHAGAGSNFPVTTGAFQTVQTGLEDAVVLKLNPSGTAVIFSTFIGGGGNEIANSIAINATTRNIFITGQTSSSNFPITSGAAYTAKRSAVGASPDIFVTQLNPAGSALVYSTYYGGTNDDLGFYVVIDTSNDAYITGVTKSTDFNLTSDAMQTSYGGGAYDAFLLQLKADGSAPVYSTYFGGSGADYGFGIALDHHRIAYIVGSTASSNFRTTSGVAYPSGPSGGSNSDVFMSKFFMNSPVPNFTANATFGYVPQGIQFNDTSTSIEIQYWNWSFGDNTWYNTTNFNARNISHTYTGSGSYNVNLTITNTTTDDIKIRLNYINISAAIPIPAFTSNITFGYVPQGVQFNDTTQSTNIQSWNWSFGDNNWFNTTSITLRNITHTYSSSGSYTVNLTITNTTGLSTPLTNTNTTSVANFVNISAPLPIPAFTTNSTFGYVAQEIWFNDTTLTTNVLSWNWSFGDNTWFNTTDITTRNATHIYSLPNSYRVSLNITNSSGLSYPLTNTNTTSIANFINISAPLPIPSFASNTTSGFVPLGVQFNDTTLSTNIQSWNWSFGDSSWFNTTLSTARNATHLYSLAGSYTVNLSITNSSGLSTPASNTNTTSRANYISVLVLPVPDFTGSPRSGNATLSVQFNDTSLSPGITAWNWSFGDTTWFNTTLSLARNISHSYSAEGTYTVNLSLTNSTGTNTTSRSGYIVVYPPLPIPAFIGTPTSGSIPLDVQFNDTSLSPGITIWNWSFGDSSWFNTTLSTARNATHTYPSTGTFTVNLTVTNTTGVNTTSRSNYISTTPPPPIPFFTGLPVTGTTPLFVQFNDSSTSPGISAWNWSFGDGNWFNTTNIALKNATNNYLFGGSFTVNMSLTNSSGTNTTSRSAYITVNDLPNGIDFSGSPRSGTIPLFVQFTDLSTTPGITAWNWSFGDGNWFNTTITAQRNANNTYINAGSYRVNLSVTNTSGTNTTSKFGYITASLPPTSTQAPISSGGGSSSGSTGPVVVPGLVQQVQPAATGAPRVSQQTPPDVPSPVNPPSYYVTTTTICILPEGLRFLSPCDGEQPFEFDRKLAEKAGYVVDIKGNSVTASRYQNVMVIDGRNIQETRPGIITGTVETAYFVVQPDPVQIGIGQVDITAQASLLTLPECTDISITISDLVPESTSTALQLMAIQEDQSITAIGYTATFLKDGTTGAGFIRMTTPPAWVDQNGGIPAIRIGRIGDDKLTEILPTTYTGTDAKGNRIFEARTPRGLSIFALIAVKNQPSARNLKTESARNETMFLLQVFPGTSTGNILIVVSSLLVLAIILVVILKRRRKYDPLFMS